MLAKTSFGYTQVAKQMVMTLGMSPEIGQRLLGGQQGGGPFMGRAFGSVSNFFLDPEKLVGRFPRPIWPRAYFSYMVGFFATNTRENS